MLSLHRTLRTFVTYAACSMVVCVANADDWRGFRGTSGTGKSDDAKAPLSWSDTENIKWKVDLPGPGSSSPIVVGNRVFVTAYSGYGVIKEKPGDQQDLRRHLICVNRSNGDVVWTRTVEPVLPEAKFQGFHTEHGYATNTPVSDGERVYVFFGKSGVLAFDLDGNELWRTSVGTNSFSKQWGSSASLVLHDDLVIVNAATESHSIRALDRKTGEEIWKYESKGLDNAFGTPRLVEANGETQIVLAVRGAVWALDAKTGKRVWFAESPIDGNASPDVVIGDGVVYAFGGYPVRASIAIRLGGKGDVTDSHVVWSSRKVSSYVGTPILHDGHLYWVTDKGMAMCIRADSGEVVYQQRMRNPKGGSLGGRPFYSSPILVGDRYYSVTRTSGTAVIAATPEFQLLGWNRFASDNSDFSGTPAIVDGQIFLRSYKTLYCIEDD